MFFRELHRCTSVWADVPGRDVVTTREALQFGPYKQVCLYLHLLLLVSLLLNLLLQTLQLPSKALLTLGCLQAR